MVHNPHVSNSDKNDDSDCCEECNEYCCVTKEECDWIKCSLCEKWLHENCTVFSKTCIDCGRNNCYKDLKNVRNIQVRRSLILIQHIIFYLITILFTTNLLFCITLYVGHLHQAYAKNALLHTFVIFIAVSKRI